MKARYASTPSNTSSPRRGTTTSGANSSPYTLVSCRLSASASGASTCRLVSSSIILPHSNRASPHSGGRGWPHRTATTARMPRVSLDNPSAPLGKAQKYARVERERRWLLGEAPDLTHAQSEIEITDIYFVGTRLRLRRMVDRRGQQPTIYKLAQKLPPTGGAGLITNTYLSEAEYELLSRLEGKQLRKVRYSVP